jgi:hypothetical protein
VIGFARHLKFSKMFSYIFQRLTAPPFVTIPTRMHKSPSRSLRRPSWLCFRNLLAEADLVSSDDGALVETGGCAPWSSSRTGDIGHRSVPDATPRTQEPAVRTAGLLFFFDAVNPLAFSARGNQRPRALWCVEVAVAFAAAPRWLPWHGLSLPGNGFR